MIAFFLLSLISAADAAPPDTAGTVSPGRIVSADSSARPVRTLPVVRVDAARPLSPARQRTPTAFVTEVALDRIGRGPSALPEALQEAAGVRVVQYGGLGAYSTLSLRGAPPGQVSVFLDGIALTSASGPVTNLADLPVPLLASAEVHRGTSPLELGPATPGGAVHLVSARPVEALVLRSAAGSFGALESSLAWAARRGRWSGQVLASAQGADGDYRYFDDNGTPLNPDDDGWSTRINNRFDAAAGRGRLAWEPAAGARMALVLEGSRRAGGLPGVGAVPAPHPRLASERGRAGFDAAWAPRRHAPAASLRASVQRSRSRLRDTGGELGFGVQNTDERFGERTVALGLSSPAAMRALTLGAGCELRHEHADPAPPTLGLPEPPTSRRHARAAWVTAAWRVPGERLLLHAGRRWDRQHDALRSTSSLGRAVATDRTRELDSPQLGARLALPWALEARANWQRSGRGPAFLELFGNQGSITGNPALAPERGEGWDAGMAWHGSHGAWRARADWARFSSLSRDLIVFQRVGPTSTRAANVARAALHGEEWSATIEHARVVLSTSGSWLSALHTQDPSLYTGRRLPQRPSRQAFARAQWRAGAWTLAADATHVGDNMLDPINFRRVPGRTLVGASLAWRWRAATLALDARNLGDRRAEDVGGFPLPGRTLGFSLEWRRPTVHAVPSPPDVRSLP